MEDMGKAPRLIRRSELARLAGVHASSATRACLSRLKDAIVGDLVNADHPSVLKYVRDTNSAQRNKAPNGEAKPRVWKPKPKKPKAVVVKKPKAIVVKKKPAPPPPPPPPKEKVALKPDDFDLNPHLRGFEDLTLRELLDRYGTDDGCKRFLESRKILEDIRIKRLSVEEKAGRLISRDLVKTHVFGVMEACNLRLLVDVPRTLSLRVSASVKAGASPTEVEKMFRAAVSKQLKASKRTVTRVLNKR